MAGCKTDINRQDDLQIKQAAYAWTVRVIRTLKKILQVNLKLHQTADQVNTGDIFVFNHFTRFETFIPQYLIFEESGAICRTVASSSFFVEESAFSKYLLNIGAVPNDHPKILPFLAEEILRGRKVIIFPEGGMVKDRRVLDGRGLYNVYSATAGTTRKHHSGAAVLGLLLDFFKAEVLRAHNARDMQRLQAWTERLRLDGHEALVAAAQKSTGIVPGNITFYPIRVDDNMLSKLSQLLNKGLSRRLAEEMRIEGNILLRDTDMDVRLGDPILPADFWHSWERTLVRCVASDVDSLEELFRLTPKATKRSARLAGRLIRRKASQIRDECMRRMYAAVTVNLSHLTSLIILSYLNKGQIEADRRSFHKALYLAVKNAQQEPSIHLHRSLRNPEDYGGLLNGRCQGLEQFIATAASVGLLAVEGDRLRFLPKLRQEHKFDEIRLENLVVVYANEVAPVGAAPHAVKRAIEKAPALGERAIARMRFDDEMIAHSWDRQYFSKPRYREINQRETAVESGEPFLWLPEKQVEAKELGVLLVHGFLASPAEVRPFGEKIAKIGYPVLGVRLKGHGTSPWDLRERSWRDWLESVRRSYAILSAFAPRICLVGFSAGGALALRLAAERPERLAGVAAICVPIKFRDRRLIFTPLVHGTNELVRWVSSLEGVMPFRPKESEHPHINYCHVPIRGLYELQRLIGDLDGFLGDIECPVTLIQATHDPIVEPESAEVIYRGLGTTEKSLVMVPAARHGILYEDIGNTHQITISFLAALPSSKPDHPVVSGGPPVSGEPTDENELRGWRAAWRLTRQPKSYD